MSKSKKIGKVSTPLSENNGGVKVVSVSHKNEEQKDCLRTIHESNISFITGKAGTGKTHLSIIYAAAELLREKFHRMVISRAYVPAVSEKMGFLPGTADEKMSGFVLPAFTILSEVLGVDQLNKLREEEKILVLPIGHLRGVTFKNSIVCIEEAQNLSIPAMRLLLTRLGEGSKMIFSGDLAQPDIFGENGLADAIKRLQNIRGLGFCELIESVRHPLIEQIEQRYEN